MEAMATLAGLRVLIVGVGGVGSWCAEALLRTGVGRLVLVDDDTVQPSNLNRQCPALAATMGRPKVEAMKERLLAIDPAAEVEAHAVRFRPDDAESLALLDGVTVVVDAIDSVEAKAALILAATERKIPLVSSMGAARRLDPTAVKVVRFDKVTGDGLARALGHRFRTLGRFPARFDCVVSTEPPLAAEKGSIMPVTAAFGMTLAAWVIRRRFEV